MTSTSSGLYAVHRQIEEDTMEQLVFANGQTDKEDDMITLNIARDVRIIPA